MNPADEILDIVDEHDRVVAQAPRGEAYARGLRHRCVFIQVRDAAGRLFVHRRTATKLVFPSLYDLFVGGVVGAGESYDEAALREAEEELGVSGLPEPTYLFKFLYEDGAGHGLVVGGVRGALRAARCGRRWRRWHWHAFLTEEEVAARLARVGVGAGRAGRRALQRLRALRAGRRGDAAAPVARAPADGSA